MPRHKDGRYEYDVRFDPFGEIIHIEIEVFAYNDDSDGFWEPYKERITTLKGFASLSRGKKAALRKAKAMIVAHKADRNVEIRKDDLGYEYEVGGRKVTGFDSWTAAYNHASWHEIVGNEPSPLSG